jgi:hypothetical protein
MEQEIADNDQLSDPYKVHLTIAVGRVEDALMAAKAEYEYIEEEIWQAESARIDEDTKND